MKGLTPLTLDLRDRAYQRHQLFGSSAIADLPREYEASGKVSDDQQLDSEFCTDYATVAMGERQDGKAYSREFHAQKESVLLGRNMALAGCDLRTALTVPSRFGFLPQETAPFSWKDKGPTYAADPTNWPSDLDGIAIQNQHAGFTWITGPYDYFDSFRAVLWDKRPFGSISAGIPWYDQYNEVGSDGIMPYPTEQPTNLHNIEVMGYVIKNGVTLLQCNPWKGSDYGDHGYIYFDRKTINYLLSCPGTAAATLDAIGPDQVSQLKKQLLATLQKLVAILQATLGTLKQAPTPPIAPVAPPNPPMPPTPPPAPKYLWDSKENARHSVRVICDEEGLSYQAKNIITACIQQESQFDNSAINYNRNSRGEIFSTDYGICQINDFYHIGPDKDFPTAAFVIANPDKAVRYMVRCYKQGLLKLWVSYSSGAYLRWMP